MLCLQHKFKILVYYTYKISGKDLFMINTNKLVAQMTQAFVSAVEAKDKYTNGHSLRVADYSMELAKLLGLSANEQHEIYAAGLLHDIGKIGIPDEILNKTSRLTDEEYAIIKTHTTIGSDILETITELPDLYIGARNHHERWDGRGYPDGLKGNEIPRIAQIISVADAYDAMTSNRSYRNSLSKDIVVEEITKGIGTQFAPDCAEAMLKLIASSNVNL